MLGAGGHEVSDPPAVCEFSAPTLRSDRRGAHVAPASARDSGRLLLVPESRPRPMRTGKTHRLKTCATGDGGQPQVENLCYGGEQRGAARAREPAMEASGARMAKRSGHAVSVGQDARRERPAMGHGQSRAAAHQQPMADFTIFPPPARVERDAGCQRPVLFPYEGASSWSRHTKACSSESGDWRSGTNSERCGCGVGW